MPSGADEAAVGCVSILQVGKVVFRVLPGKVEGLWLRGAGLDGFSGWLLASRPRSAGWIPD
jgi:hypothetical protein